jgi:hypothetical protein
MIYSYIKVVKLTKFCCAEGNKYAQICCYESFIDDQKRCRRNFKIVRSETNQTHLEIGTFSDSEPSGSVTNQSVS